MTVSVGDVIRVSARQIGSAAQDLVNVYYLQATSGSPDGDENVITAVQAWMDTVYAAMEDSISNVVEPFDIKIDVVDFIGGVLKITRNIATVAWGGGYVPASAGQPMPAGVAALIILRTLVGKVFGRKFIPGLEETGVQGDEVIATALSRLATLAANILAGFSTSGSVLTFLPGVMSTRETDFVPFTDVDVGSIGYQRRRRPGTGS